MRCLLILSGLRQVFGSCLPLRKRLWLASAFSPTHLSTDSQTAILSPARAEGIKDEADIKGRESSNLARWYFGLASELIPSPGFYRHTHLWGPHTCKSCTAGSAFHSLGKILPNGPCLSGGPPSAVLELAYSASEKLIVHIHSWLYVQGV